MKKKVATYSEANLRDEKTDGVTNNPTLSLEILRAIKRFALQETTIVLPAHDPDGPTRLATRQKFLDALMPNPTTLVFQTSTRGRIGRG